MKTYAQITEKINQIQNWIDDNNHADRYECFIAVNVKVYDNIITAYNVDDFINTLSFTPEQKDYLKELITENWLSNRWDWFLEDQRRYLSEDFINGCTISSPEYWLSLIDKVKAGEKTGYQYVDRKRTEKSKIATIQKWMKNDNLNRNYLDRLSGMTGFFGRSGGWFAICKYNSIQSNLEQAGYCVEDKQKDDAIYYLNQTIRLYDAAKWLYDIVSNMHKYIPDNWKYELEFRLSEELENFCGEDCDIEKRLNSMAL